MEKIQYEDFIRTMSHSEFKKYCTKLSKEIKKYTNENSIRIDYAVPVLRSGAVPAVYIANDLNIVKFAPIQVKKIKNNGNYEHIVLLNSLKDLDKDKKLNLLVIEGTISSRETIKTALEEIKNTLPHANILLACICVRGAENLPKDTKQNFYGFDSPREKLFVYPWERKSEKENHPDQKSENIFF